MSSIVNSFNSIVKTDTFKNKYKDSREDIMLSIKNKNISLDYVIKQYMYRNGYNSRTNNFIITNCIHYETKTTQYYTYEYYNPYISLDIIKSVFLGENNHYKHTYVLKTDVEKIYKCEKYSETYNEK